MSSSARRAYTLIGLPLSCAAISSFVVENISGPPSPSPGAGVDADTDAEADLGAWAGVGAGSGAATAATTTAAGSGAGAGASGTAGIAGVAEAMHELADALPNEQPYLPQCTVLTPCRGFWHCHRAPIVAESFRALLGVKTSMLAIQTVQRAYHHGTAHYRRLLTLKVKSLCWLQCRCWHRRMRRKPESHAAG